jgi:hypothetical protein
MMPVELHVIGVVYSLDDRALGGDLYGTTYGTLAETDIRCTDASD